MRRITNDDIDAVVLNNDLRQLMQPLFEEARLGNIDLDEQAFIECCKNLVKVA